MRKILFGVLGLGIFSLFLSSNITLSPMAASASGNAADDLNLPSFIRQFRLNDNTVFRCDPIRNKISEVIATIQKYEPESIRMVDFQGNDIGDDQFKKLVPILAGFPNLEVVRFRNNRVGNAAFTLEVIETLLVLIKQDSFRFFDMAINYTDMDVIASLCSAIYTKVKKETPRDERIDTRLGPAIAKLNEKFIFLPSIPRDDGLLPAEIVEAHRNYYSSPHYKEF